MYASLLGAPATFEALLYFHGIVFVEEMKHDQRSSNLDGAPAGVPVSCKSGMRIALVVYLLTKAWKQVLHLRNPGI